MAAQNQLHQSEYLTSDTVSKRNAAALNSFAAAKVLDPIPAIPDDQWIRERVVAEGIPLALESYTLQTKAYFLQDPATQTNINAYLSDANEDAAEVALDGQMQGVIGGFLPRFARSAVNDAQIEAWKKQNGIT
jgi:predicted ester cyclase